MVKVLLQLIIVLFLIPLGLSGQKKKFKSSSKSDPFLSVKRKVETDQVAAIQELSALIAEANDKEDYTTLYKANVLLGDINYKNFLYGLAIQRYKQAYELEKIIKRSEATTVSEKLAASYLALNDPEAISSYRLCIEENKDDRQVLRCKEGLSQAYHNNKEYTKAAVLLKELEQIYIRTDSSSLARIQALRAQNDVANNDLKSADENLQNAYLNFKRGKVEDYTILKESKERVLEKTAKDFDKEKFFRENVRNTTDKPEVQAVERLDLIKVMVEEGNISKAERTIESVKPSFAALEDLSVKADFFKQASKTYALKGDYESALNDYKKYEENQSALLLQKKEEINTRLSVLESQKNVELTEQTYSSRKKLDIAEQQRWQIQRYIIYLLALLLLGSILAVWTIWKNLRAKNILNKKLQLQSLRSQMNPHFIFNALNSVNEYIATQDEKKANKYLSEFSKLMRSVLEVNQKETIDLADEINLTELYMKLEQDRFEDKFEHKLLVDASLRHSDLQIPPLLLQPYIENAIWHGLRYRDTKGKLEVYIKDVQNKIEIKIIDNGIGRQNSNARKTKFQKQQESTGMKNTQQRMDIVEKLYNNSFQLSVTDAYEDVKHPGTLVMISLSKN